MQAANSSAGSSGSSQDTSKAITLELDVPEDAPGYVEPTEDDDNGIRDNNCTQTGGSDREEDDDIEQGGESESFSDDIPIWAYGAAGVAGLP